MLNAEGVIIGKRKKINACCQDRYCVGIAAEKPNAASVRFGHSARRPLAADIARYCLSERIPSVRSWAADTAVRANVPGVACVRASDPCSRSRDSVSGFTTAPLH